MVSVPEMQQAAGGIRDRRKALGLTQHQLAEESGASLSTVKNWETKQRRDIRRSPQLPQILDALDRLERERAATYTDQDGAAEVPTAYRDPDTDAVVVMLNYLPPEQRRRVIEQAMALIVDAIHAGHRGTAD